MGRRGHVTAWSCETTHPGSGYGRVEGHRSAHAYKNSRWICTTDMDMYNVAIHVVQFPVDSDSDRQKNTAIINVHKFAMLLSDSFCLELVPRRTYKSSTYGICMLL